VRSGKIWAVEIGKDRMSSSPVCVGLIRALLGRCIVMPCAVNHLLLHGLLIV
jgi:hypothetical protein